jgi:drug/metabolite transporter (DMT)-like permease
MADPIIIPQPDTSIKPVDRPMLGLFLRLAAMAVLGVMFVFVKLAGDHGVHVAESIFWRQLAGLPAVVTWLWWTGKLGAIRTQNPLGHGLRMILGLGAMIFNFLAMILLPMAEATTIGFAAPIFATILAAVLLGEPTGRYRWGAILLGFAGVVIAVRPGVGVFNITSATIALGGALLTGCVAIQLRRLSQTESTGAIVFWFCLCSMIPLGIAMLFFARSHDCTTWMLIAGLAGAGAVAQILLTAALRHAPVAAILTMDYSGLIWSLLFGWLFFADIPSHSVWIGAPIIIAAGLVIAWREHYLRHKAIVTD